MQKLPDGWQLGWRQVELEFRAQAAQIMGVPGIRVVDYYVHDAPMVVTFLERSLPNLPTGLIELTGPSYQVEYLVYGGLYDDNGVTVLDRTRRIPGQDNPDELARMANAAVDLHKGYVSRV